MSKKYLLLCNRHNSIYGDEWCLWWGNRESKSGYTSDVRIAHRFTEEEIKQYEEDAAKGEDIPVPIDVIGVSEEYEPKETYNKNLRVLIEKGTLNKLMDLELKPLWQDNAVYCPNCGCTELDEDEREEDGEKIYYCNGCGYEFKESEVEQ